MKRALIENWALFAAMMMLMVANGLLATLLTIRGASLGFSELTISLMQAAYPLGALIGTTLAPRMIEKVGHIRAFSALASLVSIAAIIHMLTGDPFSWSAMRFLGGFCYPGLYVITESWLNAKSDNHIRGQVLSVYLVIQLAGPALGTAMVGLPDPNGTLLFALVSILISLSIVPLLLGNNKAPEYEAPDRMPVRFFVSQEGYSKFFFRKSFSTFSCPICLYSSSIKAWWSCSWRFFLFEKASGIVVNTAFFQLLICVA